jgi:hypothetical protein
MRWLQRFGMWFVRSGCCRKLALIGSGIVITRMFWLLFSLPESRRQFTVRALPPSATPRKSRLSKVELLSPFRPLVELRLPAVRALPSFANLRPLLPGGPGESLIPKVLELPLVPEPSGAPLLPEASGEPLRFVAGVIRQSHSHFWLVYGALRLGQQMDTPYGKRTWRENFAIIITWACHNIRTGSLSEPQMLKQHELFFQDLQIEP